MTRDTTLTATQAAAFLQLSESTVKTMAERGELPGRKIGRQWRFLESALKDFLSHTKEVQTA